MRTVVHESQKVIVQNDTHAIMCAAARPRVCLPALSKHALASGATTGHAPPNNKTTGEKKQWQ